MSHKNFSVIIAAGVTGLAMLACNLGKQVPDSAPPIMNPTAAIEAPTENASPADTNPCANPYLPIIQGAAWNYKLTGPVPDTFTRTILSIEENGFTDQDSFGTGVTRQGQWSCENGALTALDPTGGGSASVSTDNVTVDFQTTSASGVTLPAMLNPGDRWTQAIILEGTETISGEQIPVKNDFTNSCQVVGPESVTVEAGTFDALRVDCNTTMKITVIMNNTPIENPITFTLTNWYVENIGLIKSTSTGSGLDSVTELVSYSVP